MKKRKYLSKKEVQALIAASQQQDGSLRDYCMLLMCFIHGLRVSELRFLKVSDIDLSSQRIAIRRLKNGFSTIHPLQPREQLALSQWLVKRTSCLNADLPWLFLSRKGTPLSRQHSRYDAKLWRAGRHCRSGTPAYAAPRLRLCACGRGR